MRRSLMTLLPMTHEDKKTILIVDDNASVGRFAAGVLAGDVWKYFGLNGNKILDEKTGTAHGRPDLKLASRRHEIHQNRGRVWKTRRQT